MNGNRLPCHTKALTHRMADALRGRVNEHIMLERARITRYRTLRQLNTSNSVHLLLPLVNDERLHHLIAHLDVPLVALVRVHVEGWVAEPELAPERLLEVEPGVPHGGIRLRVAERGLLLEVVLRLPGGLVPLHDLVVHGTAGEAPARRVPDPQVCAENVHETSRARMTVRGHGSIIRLHSLAAHFSPLMTGHPPCMELWSGVPSGFCE